MNWQEKYNEEKTKNGGRASYDLINTRRLRYRINSPTKPEHLSELEYLIINYDYKNMLLLKKYESILSEETKDLYLENNLRCGYRTKTDDIFRELIPFYLINPNFKNDKLDKGFLNDQLVLTLGALNSCLKKYRWRANTLFEFLTPSFSKLNPYLRAQIVKILSNNTNCENIREVKRLVTFNQKSLGEELMNRFISEQINRNMFTPKMAIGIVRKVEFINKENLEDLIKLIRKLDNGEDILKKISTARLCCRNQCTGYKNSLSESF